jgi:hypothetical protein
MFSSVRLHVSATSTQRRAVVVASSSELEPVHGVELGSCHVLDSLLGRFGVVGDIGTSAIVSDATRRIKGIVIIDLSAAARGRHGVEARVEIDMSRLGENVIISRFRRTVLAPNVVLLESQVLLGHDKDFHAVNEFRRAVPALVLHGILGVLGRELLARLGKGSVDFGRLEWTHGEK